MSVNVKCFPNGLTVCPKWAGGDLWSLTAAWACWKTFNLTNSWQDEHLTSSKITVRHTIKASRWMCVTSRPCEFCPVYFCLCLRAAAIGTSSTLDWFENIDKMSSVWKLPIYKPSSRNFIEMTAPSKSEQEFVATIGSGEQSDTSLTAAC